RNPAAAGVGGEYLGGFEESARKGTLAGAGGADEDDEGEFGDGDLKGGHPTESSRLKARSSETSHLRTSFLSETARRERSCGSRMRDTRQSHSVIDLG